MPKAMIAGGFNESPEKAQAFLQAYMQAFRVLQGDVMKAMQEATAQRLALEAQAAATAATAATAPTEPAPPLAGIASPTLATQTEETSSEPATATAVELPAEATTEPEEPAVEIPLPQVEGLTGSEAVPDAPTSDTVSKKHRHKNRGLPRSLRRRSS